MNTLVVHNSIVKLRPHYSLRGNDLYFLASTRPIKNCIESEAALFSRLANAPDGIALSSLDEDELQQFHSIIDCEFADIVEPLNPASERHLVVVEPHMDDAILSVGGQLLLRKGKQRITILSVFGISNYTSYVELKRPFLDHKEVTRLRTAESVLAASKVGAQFQSLDLHDAPLRLLPHDQWSESGLSEQVRMTRGFLGSYPIPHIVQGVAHELGRALNDLDPDEIWIPMGLGHHVDHRTCRLACLRILASAQGKLGEIPIRIYEDLPYSQAPHRKQILHAFETVGTKLDLKTEDISDVMDEKQKAVAVFASQFKPSSMAPRLLKAASEVAKEEGYLTAGERSYSIQRPFCIPSEIELAVDRESLLKIRSELEGFAAKIDGHKRLNILVLASGVFGSISEVTTALSTVLPETMVTINVISANQQDISLRQLGNGWLKCVPETSLLGKLIIAEECCHIGKPTIIVLWGAQQSSFLKRTFLKMLGVSRPLLVASSLSDVFALWEEIASPSVSDSKISDRTASITPQVGERP